MDCAASQRFAENMRCTALSSSSTSLRRYLSMSWPTPVVRSGKLISVASRPRFRNPSARSLHCVLLPARSTPSNTTKVPRGAGFEAATADMVRKRLKIVLAVRFRAEQLRKVKNDVKTSGEIPLRLYRDAYSKSRIARRFARVSLSPLEQAGLKVPKKP